MTSCHFCSHIKLFDKPKEDGEWQLEAGALVLSDGGICCIDEFNLMRESDRTSIHEAMEQQTISIAKAGIVCTLNTRCAVIAAANPRNLYTMSEPQGTSSMNIGIATPLLSRFDLVFILRDERIPEWDAVIAEHLLAQVRADFAGFSINENSNLWDLQKMQSHFASICHIKPKMTKEASHIISTYYQKCREDHQRDYGRTTVRLLDSMNRLAEAHARLVFRDTVTVTDAVVVIRLMESTHGFGRIVKPYDVIKEEFPLGPSADDLKEICHALDPSFPIPDESVKSSIKQAVISKATVGSDKLRESASASKTQNTPEIVGSSKNVGGPSSSHFPPQSSSPTHNEVTSSSAAILDEFDDDEDDMLSQVLDKCEKTQMHPMLGPASKIRKLTDSSSMTSSRDTIPSSSTQKENASMLQRDKSESKSTNVAQMTFRNRIFDTPASTASSQNASQEAVMGIGNNAQPTTTSIDTDDSAYQSGQVSLTPASSSQIQSTMSKEEEQECLDYFDF